MSLGGEGIVSSERKGNVSQWKWKGIVSVERENYQIFLSYLLLYSCTSSPTSTSSTCSPCTGASNTSSTTGTIPAN